MNQFNSSEISAVTYPRRITYRTRGASHGTVTRLMSPGDLGRILKPFVFLDIFDMDPHDSRSLFSIHPHSGIATITVLTDGDMRFDDPTNGSGSIAFGGVEWMRAGAGVWHGKEMSGGNSPRVKGFQLWIALGPELEHAPVDSQYLEADKVPTTGPAHVILGSYGGLRSPARSPEGITYLLIRLPAGSQWTFVPPDQQTVAWLAVASGKLEGETAATAGELLLFEKSEQGFTVQASAAGEAVIVVGSAAPHAHELHLGNYSVHTSAESLVTGEANIERLRKLLVAAGDRRQPGGNVPVFQG